MKLGFKNVSKLQMTVNNAQEQNYINYFVLLLETVQRQKQLQRSSKSERMNSFI